VISEPKAQLLAKHGGIGAIACAHDDIARLVETLERVWRNPGGRTIPTAPITYDDIAAKMDDVIRRDVSGASASILDSAQVSPS